MRNTQGKHLLALLLGGAVLLSPALASAQIKCWTNKDGVRECGNVIPPEYAQQESRTLDRRGITTEVRPRAPTAEEVEAERLRQQEEERRRAEEAQRREEQLAYDRMLLATYLSEEDIIRTRDRMAATIDASIEMSRINIDKLQQRLAEEHRRAANDERRGQAVSEQTLAEIANIQRQIEEREQYIIQREQEREALHQRYEADRLRFRELQQRNH